MGPDHRNLPTLSPQLIGSFHKSVLKSSVCSTINFPHWNVFSLPWISSIIYVNVTLKVLVSLMLKEDEARIGKILDITV